MTESCCSGRRNASSVRRDGSPCGIIYTNSAEMNISVRNHINYVERLTFDVIPQGEGVYPV
jgi:hypothetical protein